MRECRKIKKELVAYLVGELNEQCMKEVEKHLGECTSCQTELDDLKNVLGSIQDFKEEVRAAVRTIDWSTQAQEITDGVWEKPQKKTGKNVFPFPAKWRWQPLVAGLSLGILLGIFLANFIFNGRNPIVSSKRPETGVNLPPGFVEQMELQLARKQTIGYLESSQYLLSEILNSRSPETFSALLTQEKLREMLTEKKYLNERLDDIRLMKAKNICDQIEMLFLELLQISPQMSENELERIKSLVEEKKLVLKINLVKKELQEGEV